MRSKIILFLFVILIIPKITIGQQYCDPSITPSKDKTFSYKNLNNRCEGYYIAKNSSALLDLVSFTFGSLDYELSENGILKLSAPNFKNNIIKVRAVAIPLRVYYRMDTEIKQNSYINWDMKYCLFPRNLDKNKIGIYGYSGENYIPVTINNLNVVGGYYIKLRSTTNISNLFLQLNIVDGKTVSLKDTEVNIPNKFIRAGNSIEVRLDNYFKDIISSKYIEITIKAQDTDGNWIAPRRIHLILKDE